MEEEQINEFSLIALLLVTGFCFLSFAFILRFLDGVNMNLFLWFGILTSFSGVLTGGYILITRKMKQRKRN